MLPIAIQTCTPGKPQAQGTDSITLQFQEEHINVATLIQRHVEERMHIGTLKQETTLSGNTPDLQEQIQKTWRAFTTGTYLLLIDNKRVKTLDEIITLTPEIKVVFIRLTPLVGG